jgi:hypothetical protein
VVSVPTSERCVVERVASPYTGVVHKVPPSGLWAKAPGCLTTRGATSMTPIF